MKEKFFFTVLICALFFSIVISAPAHAASATYAYDALGRVVTVTYDNGTQIIYTYDAEGNRTQQTVTCPPGGC